MRIPFSQRRGARRRPLATFSQILTFASVPIQAISFTPAPSANIDLSKLGSVGIVGDFSGISLYEYLGQNQNPFSTNGSEALMARMPNGIMAPVVQTDASIVAMCAYSNGQVVLAGNFTSLGGQQSTAIALFDPNTSQITPMPGLSGQVLAVLCDGDTVYVGGKFKAPSSMNAMAWRGNSWQNLPFGGFNGKVNAITKASNGHVIFGGKFTGLGNSTTPGNSTQDMQVINLQGAAITSGSSTSAAGFSDPRNILCKTDGTDGPGSTWLLQDGTPGFWQANFRFGFEPTKLRLYNTHQGGRGTRTWRMTAIPLSGIMNFTYIDPESGQNRSCTSECPLSNNASIKFQDFHFVNNVGMNGFKIDISAFHGSGGGLNGIELFQDDIFSYAINQFNEPSGCAGSVGAPNTTFTGTWDTQPSGVSNSDYVKTNLSAPISESSASITFTPNIRETGSYSVDLYTPGCQNDGSCATRGQVNIKVTMQPGKEQNLQLYQTNDFDKYDQIYFGTIDAISTGGFRPTVTMTPLNGQSLQTMTFVAHRIGFVQLNSTTGGLNGLYEHDPALSQVDATAFAASAFNKFGSSFAADSAVTALATAGDITYISGNFSNTANRNIVALNGRDGNAQALDGGLNGAVESMFLNGTNLFVGGRFTGTQSGGVTGLNNVAVYDTSANRWTTLGGGVNGLVKNVVPVTMNITSTTPEVVLAVTGEFTELSAFGENRAVATDGFGVWVPSQNNWLRNLNIPVEGMWGTLVSSLLNAPGGLALYGGALSTSKLSASSASTWSNAGGVGNFGVRIQPKAASASNSSTQITKRQTLSETGTISGVIVGAYDTQNGRNKTVLAGHFTATLSSGNPVQNLVIIDNRNNQSVSGLGPEIADNSTFVALAVTENTLYAGGNVTGTVNNARVNGLLSYNLATNAYNTQPGALTGGNLSVTSIALRPKTSQLYVGGGFTSAGSLGCAAVCMYDTTTSTWNRPGTNLQGIANSLLWTGDNNLIAGGTLRVNESSTTFLASYNTDRQTWEGFPGASDLPGPVELLTLGSQDGTHIWATGTASNGSVYLMKHRESGWLAAGQTLATGTKIRGMQIFSITGNRPDLDILKGNQVLMLTGSIGIPGFGTASAAIFNGTHFAPHILTTDAGTVAGTVARFMVEHPEQIFTDESRGGLPLFGIVLIALAIALGLIMLIVAAGLALDRYRKKRDGYMPAPTSMIDRSSGMQRIPPHELLESLGRGPEGAPRV